MYTKLQLSATLCVLDDDVSALILLSSLIGVCNCNKNCSNKM